MTKKRDREDVSKSAVDFDGDGLSDYEEVNIYGTDPFNPDTDKDGMSDGDEVKAGRNPNGPGMLKDLFVPNPGNDYKPRALHPWRLVFHAIVAVILKIFVVVSVLLFPIEAWLTPDMHFQESKKIIALTNNIRQEAGIDSLKENSLLTQTAFKKAEDMLFNQYFAHIGPNGNRLSDWLKQIGYNYATAGENLAMGFASPEDVINGWKKSATHYANIIDPDFTEIGVGMASGAYKKRDTTFVAQHFGLPDAFVALRDSASVENNDFFDFEKDFEEKEVLFNQDSSLIDEERSRLILSQVNGSKNTVVKAEAFLSANVEKAEVNFDNHKIILSPEDENLGQWSGYAMISKEDEKEIFNPVILANLTATDFNGNKITKDIKWENIVPKQVSLLSQYFFMKSNQSPYIKSIFDFSSWYFKFILILFFICLVLNIFVEIRRQHPRVILSSLGLIGLLCLLIIF